MSRAQPGGEAVTRRTRARRRTIRRRRITVGLGAVVLVLLGVYLPLTLAAPVSAAQARPAGAASLTPAAASFDWPAVGGAAVGVVGDDVALGGAGDDGVLAVGGSTAPESMASISKIVTTLVVLQAHPLAPGDTGPTVTFGTADAALTAKYVALDGETKPLRAGSTMTELDMVKVALIASANNYAEALADWAYGSEDAYLAATRAWLAAHHLDHTTLVEPTGIDPRNMSTPSDLVAIGRLALADPVIADVVRTPSLTLPAIGTVANTNKLLGTGGVEGIKTGSLASLYNLLFAVDHVVAGRHVTIIGAVLGATDHESLYPAVKALIRDTEKGFHAVTLAKKGQPFASYTTPWGDTARAVAARSATAVVWSDTPVSASLAAAPLRLAASGAKAGTVTFRVGASTVTVPLRVQGALADPGPWWRLVNPIALLHGTR